MFALGTAAIVKVMRSAVKRDMLNGNTKEGERAAKIQVQ